VRRAATVFEHGVGNLDRAHENAGIAFRDIAFGGGFQERSGALSDRL
jgi:hypothetical protein